MTKTHTPNQTPDTNSEFDAIARRLTQVRPSSLTPSQSDSMLDDLRRAVLATGPRNFEESRLRLTVLAGFIRDVAPIEGGDLWSYLTDVNISTWVSQCALAGRSRHTLSSRRGVLTRILVAHRGIAGGRSTQRKRGPSCTPLTASEVLSLLQACESDSRSALRGYVAHVAAGVPRGTRRVRFLTAGGNRQVSDVATSRRIAPIAVDLAALEGERLIDEDWIALVRVAQDLGIRLSEAVINQTFRSLAIADDELTLAQRFVVYRLNEVTITATAQHLTPLADSDRRDLLSTLRDGRPGVECTAIPLSTSSTRSPNGHLVGGNQGVSRKTSRAASKRLAAARMAEATLKSRAAEPVEAYLATFVPDDDDAVWESIATTVRTSVIRCTFVNIETARKHAVALTAYLRWRSTTGRSTSPTDALTFEGIDAFFVHGMPDLSERSKRDYRSRLKAIAKRANASVAAPPSLKLGYNRVNPGYSAAEEVTLRRVALKQSNPEIRRRLCAIVGLCAGAGLSSAELRSLRRSDMFISNDGVMVVKVGGPHPHQTAVRRTYERHVHIALEGLAPEQLVLPELKSTSPITAILKGADLLETAPAIDTRRLRTTWICWLMTQRIPLQLALEASGLQSARTFYDMLQYLPARSEVQELRDGGTK